MATKTAVFAAGCFWGIEHKFRNIDGVVGTTVGYTGGLTERPTYDAVCTDETGHAESVRVEFDPERVSYERLLEVFWEMHDPTTPNRQGPDIGSQYRSAIFVGDEEQKAAAQKSKEKRQGRMNRKIVTEIVPAAPFWPAEDNHQRYYEKHGRESLLTAKERAVKR